MSDMDFFKLVVAKNVDWDKKAKDDKAKRANKQPSLFHPSTAVSNTHTIWLGP